MDLSLTETQEEFKKVAEDFVKAEVPADVGDAEVRAHLDARAELHAVARQRKITFRAQRQDGRRRQIHPEALHARELSRRHVPRVEAACRQRELGRATPTYEQADVTEDRKCREARAVEGCKDQQMIRCDLAVHRRA